MEDASKRESEREQVGAADTEKVLYGATNTTTHLRRAKAEVFVSQDEGPATERLGDATHDAHPRQVIIGALRVLVAGAA